MKEKKERKKMMKKKIIKKKIKKIITNLTILSTFFQTSGSRTQWPNLAVVSVTDGVDDLAVQDKKDLNKKY